MIKDQLILITRDNPKNEARGRCVPSRIECHILIPEKISSDSILSIFQSPTPTKNKARYGSHAYLKNPDLQKKAFMPLMAYLLPTNTVRLCYE